MVSTQPHGPLRQGDSDFAHFCFYRARHGVGGCRPCGPRLCSSIKFLRSITRRVLPAVACVVRRILAALFPYVNRRASFCAKIKPAMWAGLWRANMNLMEMKLIAARQEAACNSMFLAACEKLDAARKRQKEADRYVKRCSKEAFAAKVAMDKAVARAKLLDVSLYEKN